MKRPMIAAAAIASALLACSGDSAGPGEPELNVARVVVQPDSVMLEAGDTQQFRAFAIGLNGDTISGVSFQWFSSDTSLAQVDESGVATALWEGKAFITAEASGVSGEAVLAVARQELIAFSSIRSINHDIYLVRLDGTGLRRVTTDRSVDDLPDWSPDGEKIAFSRRGIGIPTSIYSVNMDGSELTNLTPTITWARGAAWSPDGERIAFQGRQNENDPVEILVMNLATGELTRITREGVPRANNNVAPANPRWSPDGARILYETHRGGDWNIYSVNADGTNPVNLTNNPADDRDPAWSPDGSRIAFSSDRNGNSITELLTADFDIWVMNADGSEAVSIISTPSVERRPDWSPDGSRFVFALNRNLGNFYDWSELYLMNADGSNPTAVTQNSTSGNSRPRWRR